ncbi:hypothetical protein V6N11_021820 [Hibiscus sabdariffa]|uniref:Uncharacterized protein n=1 Tax=Hibiscus sabdariffa TaxID=183260 RepID=A0ABR2THD1_9ROSI
MANANFTSYEGCSCCAEKLNSGTEGIGNKGCDEKSLNAQRVSVESDDIPVLRNKRRVNAGHESAHSSRVTPLQRACDENTMDQRVAGSEHDLLIGSNSNTSVVSNDMQVHHSGSEGQQESQFERMIEVPVLQASNDLENQDALERSRGSESEGKEDVTSEEHRENIGVKVVEEVMG